MKGINLKALFSLAPFYMHLNINYKSTTSVVYALNKGMLYIENLWHLLAY